MMTAPRPVIRQRPVFQQPWNGSVNKNGLPVIKGVGELQSAARMQDWRAKGSLYGDVPTSAQVAEQVQDRAAADQVKRQDAFARGYENYKRKMGAGAQPEVQSINLSDTERRRKNLIAGGAQPLQADAAIKQEQFAAQKAAMKPQTAAAPATGPSLGADAAATSVLDMPAPAVAKPVATINDGGQTIPMGDWIKAKKSQQMGDVPAMAKGGRKPAKGPILAGEEGNELKINDDETMEPIHGPQMMNGGKPGVIIPNKALKDLKKKFDKPIKGKKAAMGGRLTSADSLIGNAALTAPVGIGGTTNVVMPSAPRPPQPVSFGNTFTDTEQPAAGYGPPRRR